MLLDLESILNQSGAEGLHEKDFSAAAGLLLNKQFIWSDGFAQKKSYDLVIRFFDYFTDLFDALNYDLVRDYKYGYCGIVPLHSSPMMRKFDTIILLLLAKMHDEQARKACTELGRSTPCAGVLLDLYVQLTGLEKPPRQEFLASLKTIARHGIVQIGDIDERLNLPKITVFPAIVHLITDDVVANLEAFAMSQMKDLEHDKASGEDHG